MLKNYQTLLLTIGTSVVLTSTIAYTLMSNRANINLNPPIYFTKDGNTCTFEDLKITHNKSNEPTKIRKVVDLNCDGIVDSGKNTRYGISPYSDQTLQNAYEEELRRALNITLKYPDLNKNTKKLLENLITNKPVDDLPDFITLDYEERQFARHSNLVGIRIEYSYKEKPDTGLVVQARNKIEFRE